MIAVAVSSEANLAKLDANRANLAKLADPRTIKLDDAEADRLVGGDHADLLHHRHHPFAGDRRADRADGAGLPPRGRREPVHPEDPQQGRLRWSRRSSRSTAAIATSTSTAGTWPTPARTGRNTLYWGKYVAHDNNRDAMGLTLALTRNVLNTYVDWHAQVLHDLHESVPYLYDNTVGDGPYNAWIDPILAERVADDRLEQRQRDDQVRHAGRVHARHVRHVVARLPDVHRRDAQRHQPAVRDVRQRRRRHASSGRCARRRRRAPGIGRILRCPRPSGRSATTTTTRRPGCSSR